jgi:hypothetical protein
MPDKTAADRYEDSGDSNGVLGRTYADLADIEQSRGERDLAREEHQLAGECYGDAARDYAKAAVERQVAGEREAAEADFVEAAHFHEKAAEYAAAGDHDAAADQWAGAGEAEGYAARLNEGQDHPEWGEAAMARLDAADAYDRAAEIDRALAARARQRARLAKKQHDAQDYADAMKDANEALSNTADASANAAEQDRLAAADLDEAGR